VFVSPNSSRLGLPSFKAALNIRPALSSRQAPLRSGLGDEKLAGLALSLRRVTDIVRQATAYAMIQGATAGSAASLTSSSARLSSSGAAARLTSSEEINGTRTTSFTAHESKFARGSTSSSTITGSYNGDQGNDTLTFHVAKGGVVGSSPVEIDVRDGSGKLIETVTLTADEVQDGKKDKKNPQSKSVPRSVELSNGLTVNLSKGRVAEGDSFKVDVSVDEGRVDPDKKFGGRRDDGPGFEDGKSVKSGAFEINGNRITVEKNDSINSVLTKINESGAGVTAKFDRSTERVVLTQDTAGSAGKIDLGRDSSGFFNAVKLSANDIKSGTDDERTLAISKVSAFKGVQSGSFVINGERFSIDVDQDSLDDVITRINNADLGVTARFNAASSSFSLESTNMESFTVSGGDTGLLSALGVSSGEYKSVEGSPGVSVQPAGSRQLWSRLEEFAKVISDVLISSSAETITSPAPSLQDVLKEVLTKFNVEPSENNFNPLNGGFRFDSGSLSIRGRGEPQPVEDPEDPNLAKLDAAFAKIAQDLEPYVGNLTGVMVDYRG
jgi:hypothetical protein